MHLKHRIKRYLGWTKVQSLLALMVCILLFAMSLPWTAIPLDKVNFEILGIPLLFLATSIGLPIVAGLLLSVFLDLAEDNDRHDQRFENE